MEYVVKLQKMIATIREIRNNKLIGSFSVDLTGSLYFTVNSYSVIDYINAILDNEYVQSGCTANSEWYGVPQERRRYIVIGIRKDLFSKEKLAMPAAPEEFKVVTVGEAISDLQGYVASYTPAHEMIEYGDDGELSEYAHLMRADSRGVNNQITTKTTDVALERFRAIEKGKNFHSLDKEMKDTYSKPERTQKTIYLRLDPTKPSGTVVNVRKSMWIHPELDRAITVREAARLQSFPDSFIFIGSKDSQYQQVGNAVPPLLAKGIALKVLDNIE
jgi:DNA (cytosine-5)-methyltransferase 1